MEKKPVLTKNSRLQLSLADLNLGVQRKIAALGAPQFFKAYEHFGRPREGMTFDSMKYGLDKFGISISAASVAALFRSVGKDTFNEEEVDRALVRGSKKGVDFRKFIKAWIKDENVNLQDVLVQTDQKLEGIKRPTGVRRKPWDPKDKREGEKQLKCAMRALEENRVARLARKEIEEAIWKFVTLRSRNNFEERDLLYKLLDRPKPYISAKKFQFNILKKMGIRITDAILKEFVAKYGHAGKTEEATIHFDNMVSSFRKLAAHEKIDFFGGQGKMGKVYLRNNHYVASKDIESLMHKKIIERGNSKMGQFKQTFLMFAPERFEGSTGPGAWLQHFSAIEDEQKAGSHNLLREGAPQTQRSCASQATTITETPRTVARRYAFAQKRASNQGITASLLRQRLENFGIAVSEDQAAALFAKYDTDNNGQLSFYEFARRAVPPDYQGKGALYNLCGGESIDKGDRRNGYRPSSKENIILNKDDLDFYCKSRDYAQTPAAIIPVRFFQPLASHRGLQRQLSTPSVLYSARSSKGATARAVHSIRTKDKEKYHQEINNFVEQRKMRKMLVDFQKRKQLKQQQHHIEDKLRKLQTIDRLNWSRLRQSKLQ